MKISLHYKLFGAFLGAILLVVLYMALVMQWSFDRGFLNYVNMVEHEQLERLADSLEELYRQEKGWKTLGEDRQLLTRVMIDSYPDGKQKERLIRKLRGRHGGLPPQVSGPLPEEETFPFFMRVFLLDEQKQPLFGFDPVPGRVERVEIYFENRVVGTVGLHFARNLSGSHQLLFARQQKGVLVLVAVAGFLLAAGLSLPFSHRLTRPIRQLASATRDLASGRYQTRIHVDTGDELGTLANDFNAMAEVLERNRKARSRWFADISHELRTPISVLQGKIEALQDGVYRPDEEMLASLHREVVHLGRLVDDLYQLSLSDQGAMSYRKGEVDPCWAVDRAIESFAPKCGEKGIRLDSSTSVEEHCALFADNERLMQLFTNLLSNSYRYTDPGGRIVVWIESKDDKILYTIDDSKPGVADEHLGELFNRLYRVEGSRSREHGGAGLGLTLCRNIVAAHGGDIKAVHSELGGLRIEITLPVSEHI